MGSARSTDARSAAVPCMPGRLFGCGCWLLHSAVGSCTRLLAGAPGCRLLHQALGPWLHTRHPSRHVTLVLCARRTVSGKEREANNWQRTEGCEQ
eukprot:365562-Chlamydomonas_euryale.AAC.1